MLREFHSAAEEKYSYCFVFSHQEEVMEAWQTAAEEVIHHHHLAYGCTLTSGAHFIDKKNQRTTQVRDRLQFSFSKA